jgi:putative ABC transport system permease protein
MKLRAQTVIALLKIPLFSGRVLHDHEGRATVVIHQVLARQYWPNGNPVGQSIYMGPGLGPSIGAGMTEMVGIAGDVRESLDGDSPPTMYQMPEQIPDGAMELVNSLSPSAVLIRTRVDVAPRSVSDAVQQALLAEAELPCRRLRTMEEAGIDSTARQNFNLLLLGLFCRHRAAAGVGWNLRRDVVQR